MLILSPNSSVSIPFRVEIGGEAINGNSIAAQIYKASVLTAIVPTISNPSTGEYWVTFQVPANWINHDTASVRFSAIVNGQSIALTKIAGTVLEAPLNTQIQSIFNKVDQIVISSGRVVATLSGETVQLPASAVEQLLRLYQIAGFDQANPAEFGADYQEVDDIRLNLTEISPGVVRIARVP